LAFSKLLEELRIGLGEGPAPGAVVIEGFGVGIGSVGWEEVLVLAYGSGFMKILILGWIVWDVKVTCVGERKC